MLTEPRKLIWQIWGLNNYFDMALGYPYIIQLKLYLNLEKGHLVFHAFCINL